MACRVAGSNTVEELWEALLKQHDASGDLPSERWQAYYDRDPRNSKTLDSTIKRGYFLNGVGDFDCQFFGISPKEAEQMDPQQRLSLEVTWEALENAGLSADQLSNTDTSVFWGVGSDDYAKLVLEDLPNVDAWMGIGNAYCGVPNRLSYHFNLKGTSIAIDAACASSLVAIHHGAQSITLNESKIAIVGGVNAICGPGLTRVLDIAGALSSEGQCRSFDDDASGYGRGEGAGAVILKDLRQALLDGDNVMAILKGSAVGQDGKTNGIMAPDSASQALVARRALHNAGLDPHSIRYIEAHATSTALGDFTEVEGLSRVYGSGRNGDDVCFIGSLKPNIGHLEAGAGVLGFIKTVLALQKGILPPQTNLTKLSSRINWSTNGLKVVEKETAWPERDAVRRAAVSSYGYGGTLSHVILEAFEREKEQEKIPDTRSLSRASDDLIFPISVPHEKRFPFYVDRLRSWIETNASWETMPAIASTLTFRRDHYVHRAAIVSKESGALDDALHQLSLGKTHPWVVRGRVLGPEVSKNLVWVFSGHGSDWCGMGKDLLANEAFCNAIRPLDEIVFGEIQLSPIAVLQNEHSYTTDVKQILTYVMQIGISAVLNSYGVFPHAVIGHSVGEIAASVVAGAITPEEGTIIIVRRSVLYRQMIDHGGMLLVHLSFAEATRELDGRKDLVPAIDSSPSSCVVAGSTAAIECAKEDFQRRGIKVFPVKTDVAFHSPSLQVLREPLLAALSTSLAPREPYKARLYSTSLQDPRGHDLRDSQYWANNMTNPVFLTAAVNAAADDSYRYFLEISTHPLVSHSICETLSQSAVGDFAVIPTLTRNVSTTKSILKAIAQLHCYGYPIEWEKFQDTNWAKGMPTTKWLHQPIWRKVKASVSVGAATHSATAHNILGQRTNVAGAGLVIYKTQLNEDNKPFPGEHPVQGIEIIPAAVLLNTFLRATDSANLRNIVLRVPLAISTPRDVQVIKEQKTLKIVSRLLQETQSQDDETGWVTHTTAHWDRGALVHDAKPFELVKLFERVPSVLSPNFSIDYLKNVGVSAMGFPWVVTEHYGDNLEMFVKVDSLPANAVDACGGDELSWAPLLDAATSIASTIFFEQPRLRMPCHIQEVKVGTAQAPPLRNAWLHVRRIPGDAAVCDIDIASETGHVIFQLVSMRFEEMENSSGVSGSMESLVHQVAWLPAKLAEEPLPADQIILVSENHSVVQKYVETIPSTVKVHLESSVKTFSDKTRSLCSAKNTFVVYIPTAVHAIDEVAAASSESVWNLLEILKFLLQSGSPSKLFVLTQRTGDAETSSALADAPLIGLCRIMASEHPETFAGLIDNEALVFPWTTLRYVQNADIVRIRDGVPRTASLRRLPAPRNKPSAGKATYLLPTPGGTYLITGGLGPLGLEVAEFLVSKGARRLILVSRRSLPPRAQWDSSEEMRSAIAKIQELEACGASLYFISLDVGSDDAASNLSSAITKLSLPPIRGVVHAAGVVENELIRQTTKEAIDRVLRPKIKGALALHKVFPPNCLDFFVLFSSCGQLLGFNGQGSYASANAFLDNFAIHRRAKGDNAISILWTAWRGLGMGSDSDFVAAELKNKGVSDVSRDDAFAAWMHLTKYDIDHAVVLRALLLEHDEPLPAAILENIARRQVPQFQSRSASEKSSAPLKGQDLKEHLTAEVSNVVADVLSMDVQDIESTTALSELGLDSVMAILMCRQLQKVFTVQVPLTITWNHPTINHLVDWLTERLSK